MTSAEIEAVLVAFRSWLEQLASMNAESAPECKEDPPDLHTLLGQLIALRQEVNLQTRAVRAQQEQNAETLQQFGEALEHLQEQQKSPEKGTDRQNETLRPALKTLLDVSDALGLARRELQRGRQAVEASLEQLATPPIAAPPSLWTRLLGGTAPSVPTSGSAAAEASARVRQLLDSLITGYGMSVQRLERSLQQFGMERIVCVGQPFDPERMEVVEVVAGGSRPAGQVVEEIRPGYLWNGHVFRYAQVSVARKDEG
jgi:molecular chaperone GrpE